MALNNYPIEILIEIIYQLSFKDRLTFSQLSIKMHNLFKNNYLWYIFFIKDYRVYINMLTNKNNNWKEIYLKFYKSDILNSRSFIKIYKLLQEFLDLIEFEYYDNQYTMPYLHIIGSLYCLDIIINDIKTSFLIENKLKSNNIKSSIIVHNNIYTLTIYGQLKDKEWYTLNIGESLKL